MKKYICAVTGTNGKTSVVNFYQQIAMLCGFNSCSVGTLGVHSNVEKFNEIHKNTTTVNSPYYGEVEMTTSSFNVNTKILRSAEDFNITHIAMEASSHGLEQNRLLGIKFDVAVFTNISHDHLDYHKNMQNYLDAKLKLFTSDYLDDTSVAICNSDVYHEKMSRYKCIKIGQNFEYELLEKSINETKVLIKQNNEEYHFTTKLICDFQVNNLIVAMLMVANSGVEMQEIIENIGAVDGVKGRMQRINYGESAIFIDYAHTPDGLEKVLQELTHIKKKDSKLVLIFGCGGDRDKHKRPIMGQIAAKYSDYTILTNDNPRNEDPNQIFADIKTCGGDFIEIRDRRSAIIKGIAMLDKNSSDILLIAGKGHEKYQIIKNDRIELSDFEIASGYLK